MIPLAMFLALAAFLKWTEISVREFHEIRERDVQELLQIIIPIVLTLVVPWLTLLRASGIQSIKREPT